MSGLVLIVSLLASPSLSVKAIAPGSEIPSVTIGARDDDIVVLAPISGTRPTADCGPLAWDRHPLDPGRLGRWCVGSLVVAGRQLVVAGMVGEPPAALWPVIYEADVTTPTEQAVASIRVNSQPPPPGLLADVAAALDAWAAAPGTRP